MAVELWLEIGLWTLAAAIVVLGLIGLVFPALPGPPLIFGGLWLAAWIEDYQHVGLWTLIFLGVVSLLAILADFVAGALGAKRFGASGRAIWGATLGAIIGIFFGLPGLILGPFAGAVLGELSSGRTVNIASRSGVGATLGLLLGMAAKIAAGVVMISVFAFMRLT